MDAYTEKGDKASNSHSDEGNKEQLLVPRHPPCAGHVPHPVYALAHFTVTVRAAA